MDVFTKEKRSIVMSGIRSKDTAPELLIRSFLHNNGYRFRLHDKNLPGHPDIVLKKHRIVIFVNGCFWHGHEKCCMYRPPKTSKKFWDEKIRRNHERDIQADRHLVGLGWRVLHIWECAIRSKCRLPQDRLYGNIEKFIAGNMKSKNIRGKIHAKKST